MLPLNYSMSSSTPCDDLLFVICFLFSGHHTNSPYLFRCHMFYPRRVIDINDGKPKWSGINDDSELIADSPADAVKKRKRDQDQANE